MMNKLICTALALLLAACLPPEESESARPTVEAAAAAEPTPSEVELSADDEAMMIELALDLTWSGMSPSEQSDICHGLELLGTSALYGSFISGWEEGSGDGRAPTLAEFEKFFGQQCGL